MSESSHEYGQVIREHRKRLMLTQAVYAKRINLSRSALGNVEAGRTNLSDGALWAIVHAFPETEKALLPFIQSARPGDSQASVAGEDLGDDALDRLSELRREVAGDWFALWQTSVRRAEVRNTESIMMAWRYKTLVIRNRAISEENPEGGYLWESRCRIYDNKYILGAYVSVDGITRSKGTLYMVIHTSGRYIMGQWVGCNYDHDWAHGLVVFSRDRSHLVDLLNEHLASRPQMPYNLE